MVPAQKELRNPNLLAPSGYYAMLHLVVFIWLVLVFRVNLRLGFHSAAFFREQKMEGLEIASK